MYVLFHPRNDWTAFELVESVVFSIPGGYSRSPFRRIPMHLPPTRAVREISMELASRAEVFIFLDLDVRPSRWDAITLKVLRQSGSRPVFVVTRRKWLDLVKGRIQKLGVDLGKIHCYGIENLYEDVQRAQQNKVQEDIRMQKALKVLALLALIWWAFQEVQNAR